MDKWASASNKEKGLNREVPAESQTDSSPMAELAAEIPLEQTLTQGHTPTSDKCSEHCAAVTLGTEDPTVTFRPRLPRPRGDYDSHGHHDNSKVR